MSPVLKGEARRNQLVTTYGVGSLVALKDESFMVAGIDFWDVEVPDIHEPRLEHELGVKGFVAPPASGDDHRPDVPVLRFPRMHSCPSCRRLAAHHYFTSFDGNKCGVCEELADSSRGSLLPAHVATLMTSRTSCGSIRERSQPARLTTSVSRRRALLRRCVTLSWAAAAAKKRPWRGRFARRR